MGGVIPDEETEKVKDNRTPVETTDTGVSSRNFKDIKTKQINWLWRDQIATKVNVIGGAPGVGKSQLAANFIATVTKGGRWPDSTPCDPGSAIIITSEDDAADTLKPRLIAAGAVLDKVDILDAVITADGATKSWSLECIDELEELIKRQDNTRLIVIDPITAYVGKKDGHNTADVRGLLEPIQSLADKYNVCILMITHLNKSQGSGAGERFNGSTAWVAVSRSAWLIGPDPVDESTRVMVPVKNNLGNDKLGFTYRIEGQTVENNIDTSRIVWTGVTEVTAGDVINGPKKPTEDPDNQSAKAQAARFLIEQLKDGRKRSSAIYQLADDAGIAKKTLQRAKKDMGVEAVKDGSWFWYMADARKPDDPTPDT